MQGLHPVFHDYGDTGAVHLGEVVKQGRGHTVGTCAYDQSHCSGAREGLLVGRLQFREGGVSGCVGLKISQILH